MEYFFLSPDSKRVVYATYNAASKRYALYTIALDGSDRRLVVEQDQPIQVLYWTKN